MDEHSARTAPETPSADGAAESPVLISSLDGGAIARLSLNRPGAGNSLSSATLKALQDAFDDAIADRQVRAIILAGEGKVFCAGHDLKEMTARRGDEDRGRGFFEAMFEDCSRVMLTIVNSPKPVIAEVNGAAAAAGCQLVASCDLAIASDHARFSTPGIDIGLFCSTPMVALSRNVPRKHAMEMLLIGEQIDGARAAAIGLVNTVTTTADLAATTLDWARKLAAKSQSTLAYGKGAFYRQHDMPLAEAYRFTGEIMVENMLARDAEEGIGAFIEKRPPEWTDN